MFEVEWCHVAAERQLDTALLAYRWLEKADERLLERKNELACVDAARWKPLDSHAVR